MSRWRSCVTGRWRTLAQQARRYRHTRQTQSIDNILNDDAIDAVMVATFVHTHYEIVDRCLAAGKHVFVEKPIATSSEDCREMIRHAIERNLVLMPGHVFLYSPPVVAIRQMLDDDALGEAALALSSSPCIGAADRLPPARRGQPHALPRRVGLSAFRIIQTCDAGSPGRGFWVKSRPAARSPRSGLLWRRWRAGGLRIVVRTRGPLLSAPLQRGFVRRGHRRPGGSRSDGEGCERWGCPLCRWSGRLRS